MTTLSDIMRALDAAVTAGEAAAAAMDSDQPFAAVLRRECQLGTARHRAARDMLKAALLASGKRLTTGEQVGL